MFFLMAVAMLSWLTTNDCLAQKLTRVSSAYGFRPFYYLDGNVYYRYDNGNFYYYKDVNGDENLEVLVSIGWIDLDGNVVMEESSLPNPSYCPIMEDINGDDIVDFVSLDSETLGLYISDNGKYESIKMPSKWYHKYFSPCVVDINHDGRKDVVFYHNNIPAALIQTSNSEFIYEKLDVVTDEAELEGVDFSTGGNGSYTVTGGVGMITMANGMWAFAPQFENPEFPSRRTSSLGEEHLSDIMVADINNDGYLDVISNKYPTLLSLPDGRYYAGSLNGKVILADINSDGLKDILMFNTSKKAVFLYLSQPGGGYNEYKLIDNGSISAMYCQDFNSDGLVDIMLQAATNNKYSDNYSFVVFFINNGDGEFTKKENMLTGWYQFSRPSDFQNNGKASLIAFKVDGGEDSRKTPLEHLTWNDTFNLTAMPLTYNDTILYISYKYDYYLESYLSNLKIADFDGDGILDILCHTGITRDYFYTDDRYEACIFSPYTPSPNTAPKQMDTPNIIYDKQSGKAKVEWNMGSDAETSACDLTYTVKMGTAEERQDLMLYDAGTSTYCVANTDTWETGKVFVSVRATDANGKCGEWSPAATFEVETQSAEFTLRNKDYDAYYFSTIDTLVVHSLNGKALTYTLPDDGKIIMQQGDSAYIMFSNYGEKSITASINGSGQVTHTCTVMPIKPISISPQIFPGQYVDLDGDGISDGIGDSNNNSQGIYVFDGECYKKLPTLFNSDLSRFYYDAVFMDRTMNGLADIYGGNDDRGGILKNNTWYRWLINRGNMDFEIENGPSSGNSESDCYLDINNDGYMDFSRYNILFINSGDYENFEKHYFVRSLFADLDRDGLIDIITYDRNDGNSTFTIYQNMGNNVFEQKSTVALEDGENREFEVYQSQVNDVNGDGYPDYIVRSYSVIDYRNAPDYRTYAYLGSKEMTYIERIEIPGQLMHVDIDNNGYVDYLVGSDSYNYQGDYDFVMGEADGYTTMACSHFDVYSSFMKSMLHDMNNDGKPDISGEHSSQWILQSAFKNSAPTAPSQVTVTQDDDFVVVSWSGAADKETPGMALRYNLSVKEKGKKGDGSYIISPLNQTKDEAKTIDNGTMQYRYATRFPIPFNRFTVGKTYEVQVQTIDGWCEHSPFSKVVEFTPTAQVLFTMPEKAGVGQPVTFTLKENSGTKVTITADDGVINDNSITWSSAGIKTVCVTSGNTMSTRQIQIVARPDLNFTIPEQTLAGSIVHVELPADWSRSDAVTTLTGSRDVNCTVVDGKGLAIMPESAGHYDISITYIDDVFGTITETRTTEVVDFVPEISRVSATDDGCHITWPNYLGAGLGNLITGQVNIYRETSVSGKYELIGQVAVSEGEFTDRTAHHDVKSCRYLITLPTTYGSESLSSRVHGTVLLMANHGLGNNINLHWNGYVGAQVASYTIYSGTSRNNLQIIDEVSGNTQSYVHHRNSDEPIYYAIGYTLMNELDSKARGLQRSVSSNVKALSNVICSDEAYNVLRVQNIQVNEKDGYNSLNDERIELHMQAVVTPSLATLGRVEWSIITGEDLAEIDKNGILRIKDNEDGGFATVQARAIDGSEVSGTMDIHVNPYNTTDVFGLSRSDNNNPIVKKSNDCLTICNVHQATEVTITNLSGSIVYRKKITADTRIPIKAGVYIVKVGTVVRKIVKQ